MSSRDDNNVLDDTNVASIKTAIDVWSFPVWTTNYITSLAPFYMQS